MKNEIQTIQREVSKLRSQIGEQVKPVCFRCLDATGTETDLLQIDGTNYDGDTDDAIVLDVPAKAIRPLLKGSRHTLLYGGRAGGKSHTIARYLVSWAYSRTVKILCVREIQLSIRDSVHALLKLFIESTPEFRDFFEILEFEIRGLNGSLFIFRGMRKENASSILSLESCDAAYCEQAESLSRRSVDLLVPTIRQPGSKLIWSMNPADEADPIFVDFLSEGAIHGKDAEIQKIIYTDNPFVSEETLADAELDKRTDHSKYQHVWLGGLRQKGRGMIYPDFSVIPDINLNALPFRTAKSIKSYGPDLVTPFENKYGKGSIFAAMDIGHGASASHALLGWFSKAEKRVIVLAEYRGIEKSPNQLATELDTTLPILKQRRIPLWVDSAALGMIKHLTDYGFYAQSAPKWQGSVLSGIDRLKSLEIQICEQCEHTIRDFSLYSWKLDANDQPTGEPADKGTGGSGGWDHACDALRYGLHRWIRFGDVSGYAPMTNPYV
jgi:phage terminase large subunit